MKHVRLHYRSPNVTHFQSLTMPSLITLLRLEYVRTV
jgi:hypothetical protein